MNKEIKEILEYLKKKSNCENDIAEFEYEECVQLLHYITNLEQENERLLKTQEMYENKCNKIHQYITQNCEIIRHKDYDEVGKVNGGHILTLLAGGDE